TNEPVSIFLDIAVSIPDFATLNPIDRFIAAFAGATAKRCQAGHSVFIRYRAAVAYGVLPRSARSWPFARARNWTSCGSFFGEKAMHGLRVLIAMALAGAMMSCGQGQGPRAIRGRPALLARKAILVHPAPLSAFASFDRIAILRTAACNAVMTSCS